MDDLQSQSMNQEGPTEAPPKLPEGWLGEFFRHSSEQRLISEFCSAMGGV